MDGIPNVWMVPLPFISHIPGMLQLAWELNSHGVRVTFFCAEVDLQFLRKSGPYYIRRILEPRIEDLNRFNVVSLNISSISFDNDLAEFNRTVRTIRQTQEEFEKVLRYAMASEKPAGVEKPTCLISDLWLPRTRELATEFNIPGWIFSPFSSVYVAAFTYISHLRSSGILRLPHSPSDEDSQNHFFSLPGLPLIRICDIPAGSFVTNNFFEQSSQNGPSVLRSEVVLLNGFQELESRSLRELQRLLKASAIRNCRKIPHVWTIGPLFTTYSQMREHLKTTAADKHPSEKFLDSQPTSSVLFVSFGSVPSQTRQQIVEIAIGLENSQQPFLCVLHIDSDSIFSIIPPDCVERTKDRGLFLQEWVPQLNILSHPSIGGFVSHCGHNSMLESLCMGIPLIAWPVFAEQFLNCRFLVDEADVAIEICKEPDKFVDRRELERSTRALFHSDEGAAVRKKALQMRDLAELTVQENGSTRHNIQALVALIKGLVEQLPN